MEFKKRDFGLFNQTWSTPQKHITDGVEESEHQPHMADFRLLTQVSVTLIKLVLSRSGLEQLEFDQVHARDRS